MASFTAPTPLGRGGMGEVLRARHLATGLHVAIKRLPADSSAARREAFRRELEAISRVEHPHVIDLLAYGEAAPGDPFPVGTPWMAMELARGSLADRRPRAWDDVREVLRAVLSGLAYVHAHGILHRDLTPGNVLDTGSGVFPHWRLADFGLARLGGRALSGGTEGFRSPEQRSRAPEGPPSDLYALGCLAWWMVCGHAPDGGRFAPVVAVPSGFPRWVDRLLAPSPEQRFLHARAAWLAVADLSVDDPWASAPGPSASGPSSETWTEDTEEVGEAHEVADACGVPLPAHWSDVTGADPRAPLTWGNRALLASDPGLSLLAEREPPLVGRQAQCDALWAEVVAVVTARTSRVVRLVGAPGAGTSRLLRWLAVVVGASGVMAVGGDGTGVGPRLAVLDRDDPADPVALRVEHPRDLLVVAVGEGPADLALAVPPLDQQQVGGLLRALGGNPQHAVLAWWWSAGLPRELVLRFDRCTRADGWAPDPQGGPATVVPPPDPAEVAWVEAQPEDRRLALARAFAVRLGPPEAAANEDSASPGEVRVGHGLACYGRLPIEARMALHAELAARPMPGRSVHLLLAGRVADSVRVGAGAIVCLGAVVARTLPEPAATAIRVLLDPRPEPTPDAAGLLRLEVWAVDPGTEPRRFEAAARRVPGALGKPSVCNSLVRRLAVEGCFAEALTLSIEGERRCGLDAVGSLNRAWVLRQLGRAAEAERLLDSVSVIDDDRGFRALERGELAMQRRDLAAAERYYLEALTRELRPDALLNLALVRIRTGRPEGATVLVRQALAQAGPHDPFVRAAAVQVAMVAAVTSRELREAEVLFDRLDHLVREHRLGGPEYRHLALEAAAGMAAAGKPDAAEAMRRAVAAWP